MVNFEDVFRYVLHTARRSAGQLRPWLARRTSRTGTAHNQARFLRRRSGRLFLPAFLPPPLLPATNQAPSVADTDSGREAASSEARPGRDFESGASKVGKAERPGSLGGEAFQYLKVARSHQNHFPATYRASSVARKRQISFPANRYIFFPEHLLNLPG